MPRQKVSSFANDLQSVRTGPSSFADELADVRAGEEPDRHTFRGFLTKELPRSISQQAKGALGLAKLISGNPEAVMSAGQAATEAIRNPGALLRSLWERVRHPVETVYHDPAGAAVDLATLLTPLKGRMTLATRWGGRMAEHQVPLIEATTDLGRRAGGLGAEVPELAGRKIAAQKLLAEGPNAPDKLAYYFAAKERAAEALKHKIAEEATAAGQTVPTGPPLEAGRATYRPGGVAREQVTQPGMAKAAENAVREAENLFSVDTTRMTPQELTEAWKRAAAEAENLGLPSPNPRDFRPAILEPEITPERMLRIYEQSKFIKGETPELAGAAAAGREMRIGISKVLHDVKSPSGNLGEQLAIQSEAIPLREIASKIAQGKSATIEPRGYVRPTPGGMAAHAFLSAGLPKPSLFRLGKALYRGGKYTPTAPSDYMRLALLAAMQERNPRPMPSHR